MGTQRSAQPRRGTGSTALTRTPQGHCPRPDWKMVSHITSWSLFILWRHGWKVHPAPRAIKHRQPHPGWIRKEKGWGLNLSGNAISYLVQFLREAMNYVMVVLFLEQITFEQNLCLLLGAISKGLYLSLTTGTNRTDTEKGNMETDFVHPDTEQGVKPNSEDSSVVSDHSDNNNSEEVQGIKCTNLHSRLSGNSRKQKCPMRRYSGSGKILDYKCRAKAEQVRIQKFMFAIKCKAKTWKFDWDTMEVLINRLWKNRKEVLGIFF